MYKGETERKDREMEGQKEQIDKDTERRRDRETDVQRNGNTEKQREGWIQRAIYIEG
jgi:hypothetical protein